MVHGMLQAWLQASRLSGGIDPAVAWVAAPVAALAYATCVARRDGVDPRTLYWAGVSSIVFGLWSGHLLGMAYYAADGRPWAWLRFWTGGQVQYGNLIGGGLAVALLLRVRGLAFLPYADALAPAVALGVAIGRVGCFLNGDDFGTVSSLPWAVRFPPGTEAYVDHLSRGWVTSADAWSLPVHPVQLYGALFSLALFVVLLRWPRGQRGARFSLFLIAHGTGRIAEQLVRGDSWAVLGPFSLTQIISLACVCTGVWLWAARRSDVTVRGVHPNTALIGAG